LNQAKIALPEPSGDPQKKLYLKTCKRDADNILSLEKGKRSHRSTHWTADSSNPIIFLVDGRFLYFSLSSPIGENIEESQTTANAIVVAAKLTLLPRPPRPPLLTLPALDLLGQPLTMATT
jgi:hypothetical protein